MRKKKKIVETEYDAWRILARWQSVKLGKDNEIDYPLYNDDVLHLESVDGEIGTFNKTAPGSGITGIKLPMTDVEQYTETRRFKF